MKGTLKAGNLLRSMVDVGSSAAIAHILVFAATPLISRLFTQEDFGQFGLFFGLATVLSTLAMLGLQDALLTSSSETEARSILSACIVCGGVLSGALGLLSLLLIAANWFGYGALPAWASLLMGAQIATISAMTLLQLWSIRRRDFRRLAASHLTYGGARVVTQLGSGAAGLGFFGLAGSDVLTRVVVIAVLCRTALADLRAAIRIPVRTVAQTAWRYRLFLFFRTPSTLAFNLGTALPPVLIAQGYGVASAGLYTFMFTIIGAPLGFVQKAVGDVFIGHFAARFHTDPASARRLMTQTIALLLAMALPIAAVLLAFGPELFAFLFGAQWTQSGHLASRFVPLFVADMVIGPLGGILNVANRPDSKLLFDFARIGSFAAAYLAASATGADLSTMTMLLGWFGAASYLIYLAIILIVLNRPRLQAPRATST